MCIRQLSHETSTVKTPFIIVNTLYDRLAVILIVLVLFAAYSIPTKDQLPITGFCSRHCHCCALLLLHNGDLHDYLLHSTVFGSYPSWDMKN